MRLIRRQRTPRMAKFAARSTSRTVLFSRSLPRGTMVFGAIFSKIKKGLAKTRDLFSSVAALFTGRGRVDKEFLAELEKNLYLSDVGTVATSEIIDRVRQAFLDKEI